MRVGIVLPIAGSDGEHGTPSYTSIPEIAVRAEAAEFGEAVALYRAGSWSDAATPAPQAQT